MSWIEGISNARDTFQVFGFHPPSKLLTSYDQNEFSTLVSQGHSPSELSRQRLQWFTNISNGASYVLGPLVMLVRLVVTCILAVQVCCYESEEFLSTNASRDIIVAKEYVKELFWRTFADLIGPFSAFLDGEAMKLKNEQRQLLESLN